MHSSTLSNGANGVASLAESARQLARLGWPVFPCHSVEDGRCTCGKDCSSPAKHPRTANGLKDATTDHYQVLDWWHQHPNANVATQTGAESGIVVLDIDKKSDGFASLDKLEAEHGELPATVTACTGGGGLHYVFKHPGRELKNKANILPGIDFRGDGGYIIAPQSIHISGELYRWDEGRAPGEIEIAGLPDWLLTLLTEKPKPRAESNGTVTNNSLLTRAQHYVAKAQPASEGSRNDATFNLAGNLFALTGEHGERLSEQEVTSLLTVWNLANNPPLEESELKQCVASARVNGSPRGDKPSRVFDGGDRWVEQQQFDEAIERVDFTRITSRELAAGSYTLEYAIEGAMVASQPLLIAGGKKCLKTSFMVDAGVSLATAGCLLGRLPVKRPYRVGIMSGESGLATLQETGHRVAQAAGIFLSDIENLIWSPDIPQLGKPEHLDALERFIANDHLEVLMVDPTYLAMPSADAGNLFAQGELLRGVNERCQSHGVTLVLAHHTKRHTGRDAFDVPELEDIAWSGFQEFARQWWLLGRRERYAPGTGSHKLWFNIGGSAGHSALWAVDVEEGTYSPDSERKWEVELRKPAEAQENAEKAREAAKADGKREQQEADVKSILNGATALTDKRGTQTDWRTASGINSDRFRVAFATALRDGHLTQCELTKGNNRKYQGFKLSE